LGTARLRITVFRFFSSDTGFEIPRIQILLTITTFIYMRDCHPDGSLGIFDGGRKYNTVRRKWQEIGL